MYTPIVRNKLPHFFSLFDFPVPSEVKGRRDVTSIAPQALFFMNSKFVIDNSQETASNYFSTSPENPNRDIKQLYLAMFSRVPSQEEVAEIMDYVADRRQSQKGNSAWAEVVQAMFASAEFQYLN